MKEIKLYYVLERVSVTYLMHMGLLEEPIPAHKSLSKHMSRNRSPKPMRSRRGQVLVILSTQPVSVATYLDEPRRAVKS